MKYKYDEHLPYKILKAFDHINHPPGYIHGKTMYILDEVYREDFNSFDVKVRPKLKEMLLRLADIIPEDSIESQGYHFNILIEPDRGNTFIHTRAEVVIYD